MTRVSGVLSSVSSAALGVVVGGVGLFLVRMSPVNVLILGAFVLLLLLVSLFAGLVVVFTRRLSRVSAFLISLIVGALLSWQPARAALETRLLKCAVAGVRGEASPPLFFCPEVEVRGPNEVGVTFIHFPLPWLFYAVHLPTDRPHRCSTFTTLRSGTVCLRHR